MNFKKSFIKCLLSVLFVLSLSIWAGIGFCSADLMQIYYQELELHTTYTEFDFTEPTCFYVDSTYVYLSYDGVNDNAQLSDDYLYCVYGTIYLRKTTQLFGKVQLFNSDLQSFIVQFTDSCNNTPSCSGQYTSLQCQTEYSLIPISSVTENYCTSNFNLISPSDCPISSGTGDTQRSALWLNNVQYAGASNIYINISDLLDYSVTYVDSGSSFVVDVDGYVADTEYLDNILNIQQYHPDNEDFTRSFVGGLIVILPYVVVVLFVVFVWKLIKKVFKF